MAAWLLICAAKLLEAGGPVVYEWTCDDLPDG
jgi:hypothetical protein